MHRIACDRFIGCLYLIKHTRINLLLHRQLISTPLFSNRTSDSTIQVESFARVTMMM